MRFTGPNVFVEHALKHIIRRRYEDTNTRDFKDDWMAKFGTMPAQCVWIWNEVDPCVTISPTAHPRHLLWALFFLRVYPTEKMEEVL